MTAGVRKIAVVTGGSRGIGRAIAMQLAADGCDILLVSSSDEALAKTQREIQDSTGRRVERCAVDLRASGADQKVLSLVKSAFGRVDILVNCAGATKGGAFTELDYDVWADGFALKFFGAVYLSRALWPLLCDSRGTVINIGGGFARTPDPDFMIGGAVNAALANFTKALAKQGLRDDVNVNMVHPGTTVSERLSSIVQTRAKLANSDEKSVFESMVSREGIRRLGQPEDVANLVSFLCRPDSRHIQGTAIAVDGGATVGNF
jgi:NAD(P)-dependent dehydrogenase (short-subunit alcohol dehydrogenase family)